MSGLLLRIEGLGKTYPPTVHSGERLRSLGRLLVGARSADGKRVLHDIDLEVRRGESVAIIGANGAGKSTLLKLITGVLAPSCGRLEVHGSIGALLELGAGFDPEYSGLDNLRINAALLGLSRRQIDERLDDILAFADLGQAIAEPIKHYSSGMVVRLGFAVVAAVRPDLLITDEVLAVGDESFQKKCVRWIESYLDGGGTLLMVSHNLYQVQKLCKQAMWLESGRIRRCGDVFDVTQAYLAWHERKDAANRQQHGARESGHGAAGEQSRYRVLDLRLNGRDRHAPLSLAAGASLSVELELASPDDRTPVAVVGIVRVDGTPVYGLATDHDGVLPERLESGRYRVTIEFSELPLLPGGYVLRANSMDPEGLRIQDTLEAPFTIAGRTRELGLVALKHRWTRHA